MKQLLDGLANFKIKISDFFHREENNTFYKTEINFHGPVNFLSKRSQGIDKIIDSSKINKRHRRVYKIKN